MKQLGININPDLEKEQSRTRAALKTKFEAALHTIKLSYDARKNKNIENKARLDQVGKKGKLAVQFSEKQLNSYKYRVRKAAERYHMQSFYQVTITQEEFIAVFDFDKHTQAKYLDGKYVIVTNVQKEKMAKGTIREEYKNLKHVEHAFRDMKTTQLDIRPIFHVNADTTRGHVCVTMFAYAIIRDMENRVFPWLKEAKKITKDKLALQDIEEELKMIKLNILQINKRHEEIKITELSNLQKEIFKILKIKHDILLM